MMKKNNEISIVIPTHNRCEELKLALKSVFNQTVLPDEIIVVDDGSTEPVLEEVFTTCPKSVKWHLLRNKTARGGNFSRNIGIKKASNDWVAFLDDDDEFMPRKIEEIMDAIKKSPEIDVLYHPAEIYMVNEKCSYHTHPKSPLAYEDFFRAMLVINRVGGAPMVVCRKATLIKVGLFDEVLPALQDYELWLRLAKAGSNFKMLNKVLTKCNYTTRKCSVSKSIASSKKAIRIIEEKYADDYASLTQSERKVYETWKAKRAVHKALLNGRIQEAFKLQFNHLLSYPSFKSLVTLFALLMGVKNIFRVKSIFNAILWRDKNAS